MTVLCAVLLSACGGDEAPSVPAAVLSVKWEATNPLPAGLYSSAAATDGTHLYVLGGVGGNVNQFIPSPPDPNDPSSCQSPSVIGNAGITDKVYQALLTTDNLVNGWFSPIDMSLDECTIQGVMGHGATVYAGRLYALGGILNKIPLSNQEPPTNTIFSDNVRFVSLGSDGIPSGAWTSAAQLSPGVAFYGLARKDNTVYLIGGYDGSTTLRKAQKTAIRTDGTWGMWEALPDIPMGLNKHFIAASSKALYVVGGMTADRGIADIARREVYVGIFDRNGGISRWTETTPLPHPLFFHTAAVIEGRALVVMGGVDQIDPDGNPSHVNSTVLVSEILDDLTLGPWRTADALPDPRFRHAMAQWGSRVFIIGGLRDPQSDRRDAEQTDRQNSVYMGRFSSNP